MADSRTLQTVGRIFNTDSDEQLVGWVCASMLVLFLIKGICGLLVRWWILGFIYREEANLAEELVSFYAHETLEFHLANRSSELLRNLNDAVSQVFVFGVVGFVGFLGELTFTICVGAVLIALAPVPMGAFVTYVGLATWVILAIIRPRARETGRQMTASSAHIYQLGGDVIKGYREVHLRSAERYMISKYMDSRRVSTEAHRRAGFLSESPRYILEMVFVTGLALFAGILFATVEPKSAFPLVAFVVVIGFRLIPTLSRMLSFASLVRIGLPSLETVRPHLAEARTRSCPTASTRPASPLDIRHGVRLDDVRYRYPGAETDALNGVSFSLPAGTSTALVGRSGSGKSTLADVLCGLLRASSGSVLVDDVDVVEHPHRWNATLGVVSQNSYILDASIRENVAFGVPAAQIDDRLLAVALERAGLSELVDSLPAGLASVIGEDGSALSGGQRQRVGLARALYSEPRFLVLDEATSALDSRTEAKVTDALAALHGDVTILVIAHRLSTVQKCDQVVYLDGGRVLHVGTFAQVQEASEDFAEMVRLGNVDDDNGGGSESRR